ncbi:hypothetical protein ACLOJK_026173 [Asimina triloba]
MKLFSHEELRQIKERIYLLEEAESKREFKQNYLDRNVAHIVWELDVVPPAFTMFNTHPSLQIAARDWNRVRRDGIHLVESNSQLLLVLKLTTHCLDNNCVDDYLKTLGFYVFKMDPE